MSKGDPSRFGEKYVKGGVTEANRGRGFQPGVSGNPGGKVSLKRDLERARIIGVPPEVTAVLDEWMDEGAARLSELGPDGFIARLRADLDDATKRVLPLDPAEARAMWWRTTLPVAFAGPQGPKDSNWMYANQEVGNRLMGKPKETIALEGSEAPQVDWSKVPEEERADILAAITKLQAYVVQPGPTEH